jgi:hypothetical protein
MSNFSTTIFLVDSTIDIGKFLKSNNNFKIITFDHYLLNNPTFHIGFIENGVGLSNLRLTVDHSRLNLPRLSLKHFKKMKYLQWKR